MPVLVAEVEEPGAREFLAGIARDHGSVYVPLLSAPTSRGTHVLEVYTPGTVEPMVFLADPLGAATVSGYPVALRPYDEEALAEGVVDDDDAPTSAMRARESSPSGPASLVGRSIAGGKLRIDELIGQGGVGAVYRAMHRDLRIVVAVKVLHAHFQQDLEFCRRFHAEALAASRLDHANLMRVLDFGQEPDGLLYLAMEHLDGYPLSSVLRVDEPMPLVQIVDLMMQVCAGLAHAHSRGIVHRDVKPENVVIVAGVDDDERPTDHVKVCDFGIAVAPEANGESLVVGTPDYMSPEQCRGEPLDGRSDVYSCGIMLYELATGRMPFEDATSPVGILNRHMHTAPPPPSHFQPGIDPRLEAVILRALAKEPADRQASMRDLRRELRALLVQPGSSLPPSAPDPRTTSGTFVRQSEERPEWLERSSSFRHDSLGDLDVAEMQARLLVGELTKRGAPWLATFAAERTPERFELLANRLSSALPVLATERNLRVLFAVRCTLDGLAAEDGQQPAWRTVRVQSLLLAFVDPALLSWLAEAALASDQPPREATELLVRAGIPATYALYSVRLNHADVPGIRPRFTAMVRQLGEGALPMIRAGLGRLAARLDLDVAATLAFDLLDASPDVRDAAAGEAAKRYLEAPSPMVLREMAAHALVRFWGPRAASVLRRTANDP